MTAGQGRRQSANNSMASREQHGNGFTRRTPFEIEQRALREWPFTIHRIDRTLDPELIESRARQQLFHALNNRSLVVFAGSGLSSAYGRLSWGDWQTRQVGIIQGLADRYLACAAISRRLISYEIRLLNRVLRSDASSDDAFEPPIASEDVLSSRVEQLLEFAGKTVLTYQWPPLEKRPPDDGRDRTLPVNDWATSALRLLLLKRREVDSRYREVQHLTRTFNALVDAREESPMVFQCAGQLLSLIHSTAELLTGPGIAADDTSLAEEYDLEAASRIGFGPSQDVSDSIAVQLSDLIPLFEKDRGPNLESSFLACLKSQGRRGNSKRRKSKHAYATSGLLRLYVRTVREAWRFQRARWSFVLAVRSRDARLSLHEMAKVLLVDECAHAEDIVRHSVDYDPARGRVAWRERAGDKETETINRELRLSLTATSPENLRRDVLGIRDLPSRYASLGFFTTDAFARVIKALESLRTKTKFKEDPDLLNRWCEVHDLILAQLAANRDRDQGRRWSATRDFVSPSHRYVLEMLISTLEDPYAVFDGWTSSTSRSDTAASPPLVRDAVKGTDFKSRLSIIDENLDPIAKLVNGLGVRRFLTVNYDFELERFFQDTGYRHHSASQKRNPSHKTPPRMAETAYRTDGTGRILRDYEFERKRSSDLITFAVDHERDDASVFHLHGRADRDSHPIVTDTDYTNLYLRRDEHRTSVDESIRVAFSAAPLLFVGTGLNEADILRPLRQFVSDDGQVSGRTTFALLPGDKRPSQRARTAAAHYLRYGVHTIHFGLGAVMYHPMSIEEERDRPPPRTESNEKKGEQPPLWVDRNPYRLPIDWLHRALALVSELSAIDTELHRALVGFVDPGEFSDRAASFPASEARRQSLLKLRSDYWNALENYRRDKRGNKGARLARITNAVGKLEVAGTLTNGVNAVDALVGRRFERDGTDADVRRLREALESERRGVKSGTLSLAPCSFASGIDTYDVRSDEYLGFEYELLAQLLMQTVSRDYDLPQWRKTSNSDGTPKETPPPLNDKSKRAVRSAIRDVKARLVGLDGLSNALRTATLCLGLEGLDRARQRWWRWWLISPPHRVARFDHDPPLLDRTDRGPHPRHDLPLRFARHWPDPANTRLERDRLSHFAPDGGSTGIRAYEGFTDAVAERLRFDTEHGGLGDGRRQYHVLAPRGFGKGALFSAFTSVRGMRQYIEAAVDFLRSSDPLREDAARRRRLDPPSARYCACIYVNLCFSTEVASTFDMLFDAIKHSVDRAADRDSHPDRRRVADFASDASAEGPDGGMKMIGELISYLDEGGVDLPRLAQLRLAFRTFRAVSKLASNPDGQLGANTAPQPRFLLCINAVELLHLDTGTAKNRELEELLVLLTGSETRDVPFDLVLLGNENRVSELFRADTHFARRYGSRCRSHSTGVGRRLDTRLRSKDDKARARTAHVGSPSFGAQRHTDHHDRAATSDDRFEEACEHHRERREEGEE